MQQPIGYIVFAEYVSQFLLKLYQTDILLFFLDHSSTSVMFRSTKKHIMNTMLLGKQELVKKWSKDGKDVLEKINSSQ